MTGERFIETANGNRLNIHVAGPGNAPWVVLSNSVMTDHTVWSEQVRALEERYNVLTYDQRGHGKSDVTEGPLSFDDYGGDLLAILDACGIDRCTFVGLSMGVPSGLAAYVMSPDRFDGFVVVDGVSRSAPGREAFWTERRDAARAEGMAAAAARTAPNWMPGVDPDDPRMTALRDMITATPVEGFAAATHALGAYDYSHVVGQITCPFRAIFGDKDGAMPDAIRAQFGTVSGATFTGIPEAGHIPNFQRPDAFNAALLSFLDSDPARTYRESR